MRASIFRWAKIGGGAAIAAAILFAFSNWLEARDTAAYNRGQTEVAGQLKEARTRADAAERRTEQAMALTSNLIAQRQDAQSAQLTVKLEPLKKELTREVEADAGGRTRVADGVLHNLQAQRTATNASIAASDPGIAEPASGAAQ